MPIKAFHLCIFFLQDGTTALIWAAIKGNDKVVEDLLERGADVNAMDKVRIDMYVGSMYRLVLLCVIPLNFTETNV
jgi:hypothetical protein